MNTLKEKTIKSAANAIYYAVIVAICFVSLFLILNAQLSNQTAFHLYSKYILKVHPSPDDIDTFSNGYIVDDKSSEELISQPKTCGCPLCCSAT